MLKSTILDTFQHLLKAAAEAGEPEPTAMNLATVGADGQVSSRMVLLKGVDAEGWRFFSHYDSAKGRQLAAHPQAALCFHWKRLQQGVQVRIEGTVEQLAAAESDHYFASRPRPSQIGAWASQQSQALASRERFEQDLARIESQFEGQRVPRPQRWGGYLLRPQRVEFWYGAEYRLHDRQVWSLDPAIGWSCQRLYP